jgi:hypothetical protein
MSEYAARVRPPDVQTTIEGTGVEPTKRNRCCVCHRLLRSEKWAELGIGPTCAKRQPDVLAAIHERRAAQARDGTRSSGDHAVSDLQPAGGDHREHG